MTPRVLLVSLATLLLLLFVVQLVSLTRIVARFERRQGHATPQKTVSRPRDIMGHSYMTLWLHQFHRWFGDETQRMARVQQFVDDVRTAGFGAVMTDLPWEWTERERAGAVDIHAFQKDWMAAVCAAGLQLHVVVSMREFPPWLLAQAAANHSAYHEATSRHCDAAALHHAILQPSAAAPVVWQHMQSYVERVTRALLDTYGAECVASISPTLNNEFETRYTQTHGAMRDYSAAAVHAFQQWQEEEEQQAHLRRHNNDLFPMKDPPHIKCKEHCVAITGQAELAWMAFRENFLARRYEQLCRTAKRAAGDAPLHCLLHMGEMLATTDHLNSNLLMTLATSDAVDELVMDSNMMLWGAPTSPSVVGLMVSLARTYHPPKIIHYELATERVLPCNDVGELSEHHHHDVDHNRGANLLMRTGVIHALEAGIDSLGVTNLCQPARASVILPMQGPTLRTSDSFQPTAVIYVPHSVFYAYSFAITGISCNLKPVPCWHESFAKEMSFFGPAGLNKKENQNKGNCPVDAAQATVLDAWDDLRTRHEHVAVVADVAQLERVAAVVQERVLVRFPCVMMDEEWKIWQGDQVRQTYEAIHRKYPFSERRNTNLC